MRYSKIDSIIKDTFFVANWIPLASVSNPTITEVDNALPNPFNTQLQIGFTLDKAEDVKLQLFDLTGREMRSKEQLFGVGNQQILLDVHGLPPGSYFYVLHGAEWNRSGKVVKINQ